MMSKSLFKAFLILAISGVVVASFFLFRSEKATWTLSSGNAAGKYFAIGNSLIEHINTMGQADMLPVLEHVSSHGSVENMQRLESGEVQLAIVQNDVAGSPDSRTLCVLHEELLHIFVRRDAGIDSLTQLLKGGKRIGIGPEKGGTENVFNQLLQYFQIPKDPENHLLGPVDDQVEALKKGQVDAVLIVSSSSNASCIALGTDPTIKLVGIRMDGVSMLDGFSSSIRGFRNQPFPPIPFRLDRLIH